MAESDSVLNFPVAGAARRRRQEKSRAAESVDMCMVAVARHLESGEWKHTGFAWDGPLSEAAIKALRADGWTWKPFVWYEQVSATASQQMSGYKFE